MCGGEVEMCRVVTVERWKDENMRENCHLHIISLDCLFSLDLYKETNYNSVLDNFDGTTVRYHIKTLLTLFQWHQIIVQRNNKAGCSKGSGSDSDTFKRWINILLVEFIAQLFLIAIMNALN